MVCGAACLCAGCGDAPGTLAAMGRSGQDSIGQRQALFCFGLLLQTGLPQSLQRQDAPSDPAAAEGGMSGMHLAQVNIGRVLGAPDDPRMADFYDNLARVNAMAERMPG